jgi:predicted methyltransferase
MEVSAYGDTSLLCYPRSNSASNVIYFTPYYDYDEMHFLQRYLRPGDVVIDAGANIGTYTLLAATCVGPTGQVIAFEPAPVAFARLRENVARKRPRAGRAPRRRGGRPNRPSRHAILF